MERREGGTSEPERRHTKRGRKATERTRGQETGGDSLELRVIRGGGEQGEVGRQGAALGCLRPTENAAA